jgi:hypothetical protein
VVLNWYFSDSIIYYESNLRYLLIIIESVNGAIITYHKEFIHNSGNYSGPNAGIFLNFKT